MNVSKPARWAALLLALVLVACSGSQTDTITTDTEWASGTIAAGERITLQNGATLTITGDVIIDGVLAAEGGSLNLVIAEGGSLQVNGSLEAQDASAGGMRILALGSLQLSETAQLASSGDLFIVDDPAQFDRGPEDIAAEVDSASGDQATLVPLPPDDPAFEASYRLGAQRSRAYLGAQSGPVLIISGTFDFSAHPGDQPIMHVFFTGQADLELEDVDVISPNAPDGENAESDADDSGSERGGNGANGLRLNISNENGEVRLNRVTLNLADGGNGGDHTAVCQTAQGGNGGESGNMRISSGVRIDIVQLTINPGRGGNGGNANATCDDPGASVEAIGGAGADSNKRLYARGNVQGLENITIGSVQAGNGGTATATAAAGENGGECESGQAGGTATATGGDGGNASLSVSGLPVAVSAVNGGNGGDATATGGNGGNGGPCECAASDGGDGGPGNALAGSGGTAAGGNPNNDGQDGNEDATDGQDGAGFSEVCEDAEDGSNALDGSALLQLDPGPETEEETDFERGLHLYSEGDLDGALTVFTSIVNFDPSDDIARFNLGLIYLNKGNYRAALDEFRLVIASRPDYVSALYGRALVGPYIGDDIEKQYSNWISVLEHAKDAAIRDYANQQAAILKGLIDAAVPNAIFVFISASFAHTNPGVSSEIYVDIENLTPGTPVDLTLTGPGVVGSANRAGVVGADGTLRLTWTIDAYGAYGINGYYISQLVGEVKIGTTVNVQ
jgi:hypothetical protein